MTGYQKLKKENEILWDALEKRFKHEADLRFHEEDPEHKKYILWEKALIKLLIENETK